MPSDLTPDDLTARLRDSAPTNEALCMSPEIHREAANRIDSLTRERDEASLRIENLEADRTWWRDAHERAMVRGDELAATVERLVTDEHIEITCERGHHVVNFGDPGLICDVPGCLAEYVTATVDFDHFLAARAVLADTGEVDDRG